jgi:hypothetical protein
MASQWQETPSSRHCYCSTSDNAYSVNMVVKMHWGRSTPPSCKQEMLPLLSHSWGLRGLAATGTVWHKAMHLLPDAVQLHFSS